MDRYEEIKRTAREIWEDLCNMGILDAFNESDEAFVRRNPFGWGVDHVNDSYNPIINWLREEYESLEEQGYYWSQGATRAVIWNEDDCSVVLKITLCESDKHYNDDELFLCDRAMHDHVEDFFAYCFSVTDNEYRSVIGMEFCDCDEEEISGSAYSFRVKCYMEDGMSKEEAEDTVNTECDDDVDQILDYVRDCCNADGRRYDAFIDFMDAWDISDLHAGNWGFRGSQIIVTDYAGFNHDAY